MQGSLKHHAQVQGEEYLSAELLRNDSVHFGPSWIGCHVLEKQMPAAPGHIQKE